MKRIAHSIIHKTFFIYVNVVYSYVHARIKNGIGRPDPPPPPGKITKIWGFFSNAGPDPLKITKLQVGETVLLSTQTYVKTGG